ncbi:MAG: hypothetical protein NT022_00015 [Deltaproteobacteria bacterium]|nr:hypothetical protein [Deltaproteobacteria bacterium]
MVAEATMYMVSYGNHCTADQWLGHGCAFRRMSLAPDASGGLRLSGMPDAGAGGINAYRPIAPLGACAGCIFGCMPLKHMHRQCTLKGAYYGLNGHGHQQETCVSCLVRTARSRSSTKGRCRSSEKD